MNAGRPLGPAVLAVLVVLGLPSAALAGSPTRRPGVLVVGLHLSAPRFQSGEVSGGRVAGPRGLEIDLARAIARELGTKVDFRYVAHRAAFLSPGAKPWDIGLSQIEAPESAGSGIPYLQVPQGVLLRSGLSQEVQSVADLRWLTLCAQKGSPGATLLASGVRPVDAPVLEPDETALLAALRAHTCDAAVGDAPALAAERKVAPGRYGPIAGLLSGPELRYVIALPAGSTLAPAVARALRRLEADHVLRTLSEKWLGVDLQAIPLLPPGTRTTTVTLIGDSVSAAFSYVTNARDLLAAGLNFRFEGVACRRLAAPSCGKQPPPTALQTIASDGRALGQVVIMDIGYNDYASTYGGELDTAMRDLLAAGVRRVIWVTLRERYSSYHSTNEVIWGARRRWPELVVADWNSYSSGKPWFASDGIHLNPTGALGLAEFLRPFVSPAAAG